MKIRNFSLFSVSLFLSALILSGMISIVQGETDMKKQPQAVQEWICFGTQTGAPTEAMKDDNVRASEGIYVGQFNVSQNNSMARISDVKLAEPMLSSNFFASDRKRGILYVSGLRKKEDGQNSVYAYRFDSKTGTLTYMNHQSTNGNGVCHVSISPDGKYLAASNYSSGDFAIFPIKEDGTIGEMTGFVKKPGGGPNQWRQKSAFGHSAYFLQYKNKTRVLMCDLGSDKVYIQILDEKTGKVSDDPDVPVLKTPDGSGPRHLTWMETKDGNIVVFVLNELDSTVSAFELNFGKTDSDKLQMTELGSWSTIPKQLRKKLTDETTRVDGKNFLYSNKTAEIEFLNLKKPVIYASNRGHNTIAVFDVSDFLQPKQGSTPKLIQYQATFGAFPRFFTSVPTGNYMMVSNKRSGTIYTFQINQNSGRLNPINLGPTRIAWCIAMAFFPVQK